MKRSALRFSARFSFFLSDLPYCAKKGSFQTAEMRFFMEKCHTEQDFFHFRRVLYVWLGTVDGKDDYKYDIGYTRSNLSMIWHLFSDKKVSENKISLHSMADFPFSFCFRCLKSEKISRVWRISCFAVSAIGWFCSMHLLYGRIGKRAQTNRSFLLMFIFCKIFSVQRDEKFLRNIWKEE